MKLLKEIFLPNRLFSSIAIVVVLFIVSFIFPILLWPAKILLALLCGAVLADGLIMFRIKKGLAGRRNTPDKLSNGDENEITIEVENFFVFAVDLRIFDEIPHQFQRRDIEFNAHLLPQERRTISYSLRPVKRGLYDFGVLNVLATSPIGMLSRRFRYHENRIVPVYPSYLQMRKYELSAISQRLSETGIKKIRRIGQNQEFELIKEYTSGDDMRAINWKATARKNRPMVNHYQDERSQQVYALIDKGRVMQMPFDGMSLLDFAINASLVISNIAIKKSDKAGIITFQDKVSNMLPASRTNRQMSHILELLYHQKTAYLETDYSELHTAVRRKISQRSLLLLFTNFESLFALRRQLPYLISMARHHVLVVIFFQNTALKELIERPAGTLKDVYYKGIAERLYYEKQLIVKELARHGIHSVLTTPQQLTVNTINKYLELKARGLI